MNWRRQEKKQRKRKKKRPTTIRYMSVYTQSHMNQEHVHALLILYFLATKTLQFERLTTTDGSHITESTAVSMHWTNTQWQDSVKESFRDSVKEPFRLSIHCQYTPNKRVTDSTKESFSDSVKEPFSDSVKEPFNLSTCCEHALNKIDSDKILSKESFPLSCAKCSTLFFCLFHFFYFTHSPFLRSKGETLPRVTDSNVACQI